MPGLLSDLDPAWLDAQYNNRARIPEHPQTFERWTRDALIARERSARRLDIAYGQHASETLDVFPAARDDAPVLFFIHGGYWRALDKRDVSFIGPSFTREGAMVVIPNYALAPTVTIEAIALQMSRRWHGRGGTRLCTAASRAASSSRGTRRVGTWPRCC